LSLLDEVADPADLGCLEGMAGLFLRFLSHQQFSSGNISPLSPNSIPVELLSVLQDFFNDFPLSLTSSTGGAPLETNCADISPYRIMNVAPTTLVERPRWIRY